MNAIPVLVEKKESCCGCSACYAICPMRAITMVEDEKGFLYPNIDSKKCIACGSCIKVCPIRNEDRKIENFHEPEVFAVKHKSVKVRMNSSSGGMFTAISDHIIDMNGVIYGAAFDKDFRVCHMGEITKTGRDKFQGSKYVQSDMENCFQEIKKSLLDGKSILFSGTPCQVAGLNNCLSGVDISKLITVDNICHGTPSPKILRLYLENMKSRFNSNIKSLNFRYKPSGWRTQAIKISLENGQEYIEPGLEDPYYRLFLHNIILRDACYQCVFSNLHRTSDITLGDFWGIEKSLPEYEDEIGVSIVLVNTDKGRKIFNSIIENGVIDSKTSNIADCMQHNLKEPSIRSPKTEKFWADYQKRGFIYVLKKYGSPNWKREIKKILEKLGIFNLMKKKYT